MHLNKEDPPMSTIVRRLPDDVDAYELYHHGIKGQKWGVRRYQNADGSLTPAGQKRYEKVKNVSYRDYTYDLNEKSRALDLLLDSYERGTYSNDESATTVTSFNPISGQTSYAKAPNKQSVIRDKKRLENERKKLDEFFNTCTIDDINKIDEYRKKAKAGNAMMLISLPAIASVILPTVPITLPTLSLAAAGAIVGTVGMAFSDAYKIEEEDYIRSKMYKKG